MPVLYTLEEFTYADDRHIYNVKMVRAPRAKFRFTRRALLSVQQALHVARDAQQELVEVELTVSDSGQLDWNLTTDLNLDLWVEEKINAESPDDLYIYTRDEIRRVTEQEISNLQLRLAQLDRMD